MSSRTPWAVEIRKKTEISGWLNRRRYVAQRNQLERDVPLSRLERIEVRATRPSKEGASVAVNMTLFYQPDRGAKVGRQVTIDGLNEGERTLLEQSTHVELKKRPAQWWEGIWLALALIVSALLAWFGLFFIAL